MSSAYPCVLGQRNVAIKLLTTTCLDKMRRFAYLAVASLFLSRNVCPSDFGFVAVVVGRKCFAIMHLLGILCGVLPCLVYSNIQKSLSFPLTETKQRSRWWQCQGSWATSATLRQGSSGFAQQLFSSLTKLMDRNSFILLRCICLCRRTWDCGICVYSFYWAPQPGFLWVGICSDMGNLWATSHLTLCGSSRANTVGVRRYLALCGAQSQPL